MKKILEIGSGNGFVAEQIRKAGYEIIAMDISKGAIEVAQNRYPKIQFLQCACDSRWRFWNEEFDGIYSFEVIEHVLDIYTMLAEMTRVLKLGGIVSLTTPFHGLIKNLFLVLFNFDKHFCNIEGGHIRFFSNRHLRKLLNEFGFQIIECKLYGRFWPLSKGMYVVARKIDRIEK